MRFEVGDAGQLRIQMGNFDVAGTQTHGSNYLENADLFRTFTAFDCAYLEKELGKRQFGHPSRWTDPRVDEILKKIQGSNPTDVGHAAADRSGDDPTPHQESAGHLGHHLAGSVRRFQLLLDRLAQR